MAIKTQLRLLQMTGSLDDTQTAVNNPANIADQSIQGPLDQLASAIKRITGGSAYTSQAAGEFTHADTVFSGDITVTGNDVKAGSDAAATLFAEVTSADITLGGGGKVITAGDIQMNGTALNGDADEARNIFAVNTGQPITLGGGGVVVTAGQLKVAGGVIQDDGGDARIGFPDAGDLTLNDKDGNTGLTVNGVTREVSLAQNLQVTGLAGLGHDVWVGRELYVSGSSITLANDAGLWSADSQLQDFKEGNTRVMGAEGLYVDNQLYVSGANASVFAGTLDFSSDANRTLFSTLETAELTLGGGGKVIFAGDAKLLDDQKLSIGSDDDGFLRYDSTADHVVLEAGKVGDAANLALGVADATSQINLEFASNSRVSFVEVAGQGAMSLAYIMATTGQHLVLSGAEGRDLDLQGSKQLKLGDYHPDFASGWSSNYIPLSTSSEEWDSLASIYGDGVSILQAIISGSSAGESRVKSETLVTGSAAANSYVDLTAWSTSGILESAAPTKIDVFVNGQLLVSGSAKGSDGGGDYSIGNWTGENHGAGVKSVAYFNFDLEVGDQIVLISR